MIVSSRQNNYRNSPPRGIQQNPTTDALTNSQYIQSSNQVPPRKDTPILSGRFLPEGTQFSGQANGTYSFTPLTTNYATTSNHIHHSGLFYPPSYGHNANGVNHAVLQRTDTTVSSYRPSQVVYTDGFHEQGSTASYGPTSTELSKEITLLQQEVQQLSDEVNMGKTLNLLLLRKLALLV